MNPEIEREINLTTTIKKLSKRKEEEVKSQKEERIYEIPPENGREEMDKVYLPGIVCVSFDQELRLWQGM